MRFFFLFTTLITLMGCNANYANQSILDKNFPSIKGQSLNQDWVKIPNDFTGKPTLLLIGYKQNAQFDIDRWLIGLDMTNTQIDVYEIPTIQGLFPKMFKTTIDNGMRKGIPKELWKGVITVYEDGDLVQAFTGNESPNNARVLLLNSKGKIIYFYDRGFSVSALNKLKKKLSS